MEISWWGLLSASIYIRTHKKGGAADEVAQFDQLVLDAQAVRPSAEG